jgi:hypothetical protein
MRTRTFAGVCLLLMAAAACADDCPTAQSCDIRSLSCQLVTFQVAQCLRGSQPGRAMPAVNVVDAKTFIDSQVDQSEQTSQQSDDSQRGLALLGLAERDVAAAEVVRTNWNQVGAFFSSDSGEVTVLDRSGDLDSPSAVLTLVHEFIHALQAIQGRPDPSRYYDTFDGQLALGAIQEGEAELYTDLAAIDGYGFDRSDANFAAIYREFRERAWNDARKSDLPVSLAYTQFTYAFGGEYLNRPYRQEGQAPVRELLTDPPLSSRQILAGPIAVPAERPKRDDPYEVGRPVLGDPFVDVSVTHLGAWLFEAFRDRWASKPRSLDRYEDSGFSGDVLTMVRDEMREISVIWRLRFDDADQAEQMLYELRDTTPFKLTRIDRDLALVGSTAPELPDALQANLKWTELPEPQSISSSTVNRRLCLLR